MSNSCFLISASSMYVRRLGLPTTFSICVSYQELPGYTVWGKGMLLLLLPSFGLATLLLQCIGTNIIMETDRDRGLRGKEKTKREEKEENRKPNNDNADIKGMKAEEKSLFAAAGRKLFFFFCDAEKGPIKQF